MRKMWINAGVLGFLGFNTWLDLKKQEVSLVSAGMMGITGLVLAWYGDDFGFSYFCGILIGLLIFGIGVLTGGNVGIGDGFVVLALGTVLEWRRLIVSLILGLFLCAVASAVLMFAFHKGRKTRIPFIPFLLMGYIGGFFIW